MRGVGIIIAIVGLLVLFGGMTMDTTETTTTCYEADYSWDYADSSGCVETTYSNPAPKIGAMMFGFSMLIGGGVLMSRSGDSTGSNPSGLSHSTNQSGSQVSEEDSFAAQLKDHQNQNESDQAK